MFWLKEPDSSAIPIPKVREVFHELWETMKNQTTLYLLIFVLGNSLFMGMVSTGKTTDRQTILSHSRQYCYTNAVPCLLCAIMTCCVIFQLISTCSTTCSN